MPLKIKEFLHDHLTGASGFPSASELQVREVSGGSINAAFQLSTNHNSRWFAKFNETRSFPHLFVAEATGLSLLRSQGIIRVPEIIAQIQQAGHQLLILEWIDEGPRTARFWQLFGEQLSALHRVTQPQFGLGHNNYMGSLPQDNTPTTHWVDFFIHRRLEPQIKLAADHGRLNKSAIQQFQSLYNHLPALFPPEPPPCSMATFGPVTSSATPTITTTHFPQTTAANGRFATSTPF